VPQIFGQGLGGAIACYHQALAIDPKDAKAHTNLGLALKAKGDMDGAIACFQKALALDPKYAPAHIGLGNALSAKGELERGIACYREALALVPKYAPAHYNLGVALQDRGRLDGAIACFQKALALDPKHALAHGALGRALLGQGRFREARDRIRHCLQLLPKRHQMRSPMSQRLRHCERLLVLEARLPALLQGKAPAASPGERLEYAALCRLKRLLTAAVRFYAEAFTTDSKLAETLLAPHRYNAACAAALAAAGQGQDADQLTAQQRARLCQQALTWLRADLDCWTKILATGIPQARATVQQQLQQWQRDPDLAGIRDAAWLVNLPDNELHACRQLWADVAALLQRAERK
jgi:Flp pilus assembly protein TadD